MSVYEIVTEKIVNALKAGTIPWRQPWVGCAAQNLVSRKAYRGINVFLLMVSKYKANFWVTYNQARKLGGYVKAGEKGTLVVFWKMLKKADANGVEKNVPLLRYYTVFNIEQTEGLTSPALPVRAHQPVAEAEDVIKGYENPPAIEIGGNEASYCKADDKVRIPQPEHFKTAEGYYSALFHELAHSTRHPNRLNREGGETGMDSYAKEELIAEMSACFLSSSCGFAEMEQPDNHAAYIASWLRRLENDPKMVVNAASAAQKATEHVLGHSLADAEGEEETADNAVPVEA
jgi:antirestriction protein ArdC